MSTTKSGPSSASGLFFVITKGYGAGLFFDLQNNLNITAMTCHDSRLEGLNLEVSCTDDSSQKGSTTLRNIGTQPVLYKQGLLWSRLGRSPVALRRGMQLRICSSDSTVTYDGDTYGRFMPRPQVLTWNVPQPKKRNWYMLLSLPWLILMPVMLLRFLPLSAHMRWIIGGGIYSLAVTIAIIVWVLRRRKYRPPHAFALASLAMFPPTRPGRTLSELGAYYDGRRTLHLKPGDTICFAGPSSLSTMAWWLFQILLDPCQDVRVVIQGQNRILTCGSVNANDTVIVSLTPQQAQFKAVFADTSTSQRSPVVISAVSSRHSAPLWAHRIIECRRQLPYHFPWWNWIVKHQLVNDDPIDQDTTKSSDLPTTILFDDIADQLFHKAIETPQPHDTFSHNRTTGQPHKDFLKLIQTSWTTYDKQQDLVGLLGQNSEGVRELNMTRDGPHMLVAGTTGSGKSEALLSWLIGLALRYSPARLQMILVDYKGGAAFDPLLELPHVTGVLTDLDPYMVTRALGSLYAELQRRERIGAYDRQYGTDHSSNLPRLLIVVDEFQALVSSHPNVMDELIRLATLGRSLGMYLIIATQRPAGIVDGHIRANMSIRLCLRLREASDSMDVLGGTQAAELPAIPGRALLQTDGLEPIHMPWLSKDIALLVQAINNAWVKTNTPTEPPPWAPALPEKITLNQCLELCDESTRGRTFLQNLPTTTLLKPPHKTDAQPKRYGSLQPATEQILIGITDDVAHQRLTPCYITCQDQLMVIGGPHSGKTTTLQTIAYQYKQAGYCVHAIMQSRPCPAVDTWINPHELRLASRLLRVITQSTQCHKNVLLIDDCDELAAALDEEYGVMTAQEAFSRLLREAGLQGIGVIMSSGPSFASMRWAQPFANRLVLPLRDDIDALHLGVETKLISGAHIPGRAVLLRKRSQKLVHIALSPSDSSLHEGDSMPDEQNEELEHDKLVSELIRPLPREVKLAPGMLGVAGDRAEAIEVPKYKWWIIVGEARSGKTTTAHTLGARLTDAQIIDNYEDDAQQTVKRLAELKNGAIVTMLPETFTSTFDPFLHDVKARAHIIVLGNACHNRSIIPVQYRDLAPLHEHLPGRSIMCSGQHWRALRVAQIIK